MKRNTYTAAAIAAAVLVTILGVAAVDRVANETIAAYEKRNTVERSATPTAIIPAPLLEPELSTVALPMPTPSAKPEETETPARSGRYAGIELAAGDYETLARLVWLEARGEPFEGQVAVVEVVLNRILSPKFPDTVEEVIYQTEPVIQFPTSRHISEAEPGPMQYEAVEAALHATEPITDADVVYFSTEAQNARVFAVIGNHVFCRE